MGKQLAAGDERTSIGLRILQSELDEIDRRAEQLHYTRTDYMIWSALGQSDRLEELERRLARLEGLASDG